ncbi:MAG: type IX secretion system sortase PorU, partial [Fulvivirga sp.]|nr:type IX secretion system sortase PorU [Fulvivirga sp.]
MLILLSSAAITAKAQQEADLSQGTWYKMSVSGTGVYKLSRSALVAMGINVDQIDPRKIQIFGNEGGILPQSNSADRPSGLQQTAIMVIGEEDGSFDSNDLVVFFASGPDAYAYNNEGDLNYEHNIYSRENFYFITVGKDDGLRIPSLSSTGTAHSLISSFDDFRFHELTQHNLLISGREWYGERFDLVTNHTIDFNFPDRVPSSEITVTSAVMAQSFAPSAFKLSLNGINLGEQTVESVPDFRQRIFRYSVKGKEDKSTFSVPTNTIGDSETLSLEYTYQKNNSGRSIGYLNFVMVEGRRKLQWNGTPQIFRSLASTDNVNSTYQISNAAPGLMIWNVTNTNQPAHQGHEMQNNQVLFGAASAALQEYAMFTLASLSEPVILGQINNQNIRNTPTPDLLIVTHPDFRQEAARLVTFRRNHDQLSVAVTTTEEIYHEFSSGRQDVTAIRDFARHLYNKSSQLKYVLLFGRGSYDYLDVIPNNTNFVPIYESRSSLHPLTTYGSDDYFGFLEDDEGEWVENASGKHSLDVGVGRLPVSTPEEARGVVDKLIAYASDKSHYGDWRNRITFVADDGDFNLHQRQADELTQFVDSTFEAFNAEKLYLDAFEQQSKPGGEVSPKAQNALDEAVVEGSLIVNFTGHGGEIGWMQEQVLDLLMIREWENNDRLPLFVTATCEFGRHDDPRRVSGGELVLTNPEGG